jgi:hypothetical protein
MVDGRPDRIQLWTTYEEVEVPDAPDKRFHVVKKKAGLLLPIPVWFAALILEIKEAIYYPEVPRD